jgi:hypothetical protein
LIPVAAGFASCAAQPGQFNTKQAVLKFSVKPDISVGLMLSVTITV